MKRIEKKWLRNLIPLMLLCNFFVSRAQSPVSDSPPHAECGTTLTTEHLQRLEKFEPQVRDFIEKRHQHPDLPEMAVNIPIKVHIVRQSNGTGGFDPTQVPQMLSFLNSSYSGTGLTFVQCGSVSFIDNSTFFNYNESQESALAAVAYTAKALNLYLINTVTSANGTALNGYAYFPQANKPDYIFVRADKALTATLPHEIGHYFFLYHTHGKVNCGSLTDELANGSNCAVAGDNICDTPADPNLQGPGCDGSFVNSGCQYIGSFTDANGQPFNPKVKNFMSYAPNPCRTEFSPDQKIRIAWAQQNFRNYLDCGAAVGYCTSKGNSTVDEWIQRVEIGTLNNSSGNNSGYKDYTSLSVDLATGTPYTIKLTPGYSLTTYTERWRIWIDLNKDKDFDDPNELVFDNGNASSGVVNGTMTVSPLALTGSTRMRISMKYASGTADPPSQCNNYDYGETEDYTVILSAGTGGPSYCVAFGQSASGQWIQSVNTGTINNISGSNNGYSDFTNLSTTIVKGATQSITLSPGFFNVPSAQKWRVWIDLNQDKDFNDAGELVLENGTPSAQSFTGNISIPLTASLGSTRMRIAMKLTDAANPSLPSPCGSFGFGEVEDYSINIVTNDNGGNTAYCASKGVSFSNSYIRRFSLNTIKYSTGGSSYSDFTSQVTNVARGSAYNLILTPFPSNKGDSVSSYPYRYWRIWADFNQDKDFNDPGELAFESVYAYQQNITGRFPVPKDALLGQTRIRVSMKTINGSGNDTAQVACGNFPIGEVEDYSINVIDEQNDYCIASGEITKDEWIGFVKFNTISNFSLSDNGYGDYTNISTTVEKGKPYTIELTPQYSALAYSEAWRVYADWNRDFDFDDEGELALTTTNQVGAQSGTITIPPDAISGNVRMRVVMKYTNIFDDPFYPSQCGGFTWGEVEDYTLNIVGGDCGVPVYINFPQVGYSHIRAEWASVAGATGYHTRIRKVGEPNWTTTIQPYTTPTNIWLNMQPNTQYELQARAVCGSQEGAWSAPGLVTTAGDGDPYCYSFGIATSNSTWIQSVKIGSINNNSGNNFGYFNFTALKTQLAPGDTYNVTLTPGTGEPAFNFGWRIWIDFNKDNDFEDAGEKVLEKVGFNNSPLTTTITIPANAIQGVTRMRISMNRENFAGPCQIFGYRDVEDYTVNIQPTPALIVTPDLIEINAQQQTRSVLLLANFPWNISSKPSWVTSVSPSTGTQNLPNGQNVNITCSANTNTQTRSGIVEFSTSTGDKKTVTIIQEGQPPANPLLTLSQQTLNFNGDGTPSGPSSTLLTANEGWSLVSSPPSWMTISSTSGASNVPSGLSINVTCEPNLKTTNRNASLTFRLNNNPNFTVVLTINQSGQSIIIANPKMLDYQANGSPVGSNMALITANFDWNVVANYPNWISINPASGTDNMPNGQNVTITCANNTSTSSRTATLAFRLNNGATDSMVVKQNGVGPTITLSQNSLNYKVDGTPNGSGTTTLTANQTWSVLSGYASWVTVGTTSGAANAPNGQSISITCSPNAGTSSRSTIITFRLSSGNAVDLTVTQDGAFISLSQNILNYKADGSPNGASTTTLTANQGWSVVTGYPSWVTISASTGSANAPNGQSINITCSPNASTSSRSATITFRLNSGNTVDLTVNQDGLAPAIDLSQKTLSYKADGTPNGASTTTLTANQGWSVVTGYPSWVTVGTTSGTANTPNGQSVSITCSPNGSTSSRSATITFRLSSGNAVDLTVNQDGLAPAIDLSQKTLTYKADGTPNGASTTTLTANQGWSVVTGYPSWVTVGTTSGAANAPNGQSVSITCSPNGSTSSRSATITFRLSSGNAIDLTVNQDGLAPAIDLSQKTLTYKADGTPNGASTTTLTANQGWSVVTGYPSWVTVGTTSGAANAPNGQSISITCSPNASTSSRSATITFRLSSGNTVDLTVNQDGQIVVPSIDLSLKTMTFKADGNPLSTNLTKVLANQNWTASNGGSNWITISPASGSANLPLGENALITCLPNPNTTSRTATVIFSLSGGQNVQLSVLQEPKVLIGPWKVDTTGENHTIIIPATLSGLVDNKPLVAGDQIGVFFVHNNVEKCAGFGTFTGQNNSFSAFGNELSNPGKNGFALGENFRVKIWRASENRVFDVIAEYAPVGTNGIITHLGSFANDGLSMLVKLETNPIVTLNIPLQLGWNMISSYVNPLQANMLQVFTPINSSVDLVKDVDGKTTIPSLSINNIGNWDVRYGYRVRANKNTTLPVQGIQVLPQSTPIPLKAGWQIIAYLRDNEKSIATELSSVSSIVELVKDNAGKTFIPAFGINNIGNMKPTQGYKLKAKSNGTLTYSPNFGSIYNEKENWVPYTSPGVIAHFMLDSNYNTGNNANLVFTTAVVEPLLKPGDEIGVFTPSGVLCGAAVYQGQNLAITAWGDDPATQGVKEGLMPGETYRLKVWLASANKEYSATATYSIGDSLYQEDDIEVAGTLSANIVSTGETIRELEQLLVMPNPNNGVFNVVFSLREEARLQCSVLAADGRTICDWPAAAYAKGQNTLAIGKKCALANGVYLLRLRSETGSVVKKVIVQD